MGGGGQTTSSTTQVIDPGRDKLINLAMPFLEQFAAAPPQLPTAGTVTPFDPAQVAGQNMALQAAGTTQPQLATSGSNLSQFLSGDVLSPYTNPALAQTIQAATLPIEQQLTESTLPNIRGAATAAGQFGGSRQGIAEGLASRGASQAIGSTAAGIANQGYQSGLDAAVKNLALLPSTMGAQTTPATTTSAVGDVRQQMAQALLGQTNLYQTYPELLPLLMGQSLVGLGAAIPPSGQTTTGSTSGGTSALQGLGAGISGLGTLMGFFSDRRLKRDIVRIGTMWNLPYYIFRYIGDQAFSVGVMADEAPAHAVIDVMGFGVVDYGRL